MIRAAETSIRVLALAVALGAGVPAGEAAAGRRELRVCADPDNLPFSNERRQGFENKIAELIAKDMNAVVHQKILDRYGIPLAFEAR